MKNRLRRKGKDKMIEKRKKYGHFSKKHIRLCQYTTQNSVKERERDDQKERNKIKIKD